MYNSVRAGLQPIRKTMNPGEEDFCRKVLCEVLSSNTLKDNQVDRASSGEEVYDNFIKRPRLLSLEPYNIFETVQLS